MSVYGKLAGAMLSVAIVGGSAAYVMSVSDEVIADVTSISEEISCYTIREYDGNIALYKDGQEEPVAVYSIPVEGISEADRALLHEGIRLQGLSEVSRLLEDLDVE